MNNTLQVMRSLRLSGMADRYEAIFTMPSHQRPQTEILIAQLLEAEDLSRKYRRSTLAIKQAKFRYQAGMQQLSFTENRNLSKETITSLGDCSFIDRGENIIITGASAIGHQACVLGKKVAYFSLPKLLSKLKTDKIDGAFRKEIERIERKQLLILDDWGLTPLDTHAKLALLQIIEDRHNKYATIITSQLPISAWHQYIDDDTIADTILDRIIHQAHRIELQGESMRKSVKNKTI
jgi:DNA replication protein DnaC